MSSARAYLGGMKWIYPLAMMGVSALSSAACYAQSVTFHADIAPIIYNECTLCLRVGEIGAMPFSTYAEVAAYGNFIEYVTQTGYMPPWTPTTTTVPCVASGF